MILKRMVLAVSQRPLTLILLQKYRDTYGRRIVIQIGGVYATLCQEEGILLQRYAIEMGGVSRYFSKVSGSGVDFRERPPGLFQHVLTVLVFWFQVLLMPGSQASSRSLGVWTGTCFITPFEQTLGSAAPAPLPPV